MGNGSALKILTSEREAYASKLLLEAHCRGCGACCHTFPVFVSNEDAGREPRIKQCGRLLAESIKTEQRTYQLFPLPFLDCCTFLDQEKRCRIYTTRPTVCRNFEVGSDQCNHARLGIGLGKVLR